jgi:nanoRNase/pAp phosphatase (c-di-AMP/oligoRNAs hydrolase)
VAISRYAPYVFFPEARYAAGIVRSNGGAKITAMRNPWRDFPSVKLGRILARFGGGGHERVGSLIVPNTLDARATLDKIVNEIRSEDMVPQLRENTA